MTRVSLEEGNSSFFFISAATNTRVIDSGAPDHMTSNPSLLNSLILSPAKSVQVSNGNHMPQGPKMSHFLLHSCCPLSYLHHVK